MVLCLLQVWNYLFGMLKREKKNQNTAAMLMVVIYLITTSLNTSGKIPFSITHYRYKGARTNIHWPLMAWSGSENTPVCIPQYDEHLYWCIEKLHFPLLQLTSAVALTVDLLWVQWFNLDIVAHTRCQLRWDVWPDHEGKLTDERKVWKSGNWTLTKWVCFPAPPIAFFCL